MTKFYTGKGDNGTSKIGNFDLSKDHQLFRFLGSLDELNSWFGYCRASLGANNKFKTTSDILKTVQDHLFVCQTEVAAIGGGFEPKFKVEKRHTEYLEKSIKEFDSKMAPLTKFIIPGASQLSAMIDVARTVARRTESEAKTYSKEKEISSDILSFLNRFSSLLFAMARFVNHELKIEEENPNYS